MKPYWMTMLVGLLVAADDTKTAQATDRERLQGTWVVVSAEMKGQPFEVLKGSKIVFSGETVTFKAKEQEGKGTFAIDPAAKPRAIDLSKSGEDGKKETDAGVYQLDGDELKLCLGGVKKQRTFPDGKEDSTGSKRPTGFDSRQGVLLILKRER